MHLRHCTSACLALLRLQWIFGLILVFLYGEAAEKNYSSSSLKMTAASMLKIATVKTRLGLNSVSF